MNARTAVKTHARTRRNAPASGRFAMASKTNLQRSADESVSALQLQTMQNAADQFAGPLQMQPAVAGQSVIQLAKVSVSGGQFEAEEGSYYAINEAKTRNPKRGARMVLNFYPKQKLAASEVSLVQTTNSTITNKTDPHVPDQTESLLDDRRTNAGSAIDQQIFLPEERNMFGGLVKPKRTNLDPRYHEERGSVDEPLANPRGRPSGGQAAVKSDGVWSRYAMIKDEPGHNTTPGDVLTGAETFEVAAMTDGSEFVGSVRWGWRMTGDNKAVLDPDHIAVVNYGGASDEFIKAADAWNKMPVVDPETGKISETIKLPTPRFKSSARMMMWLQAMFKTYPNLQQMHLDTVTDADIGAFVLTGVIARWETAKGSDGGKFNEPILQRTLRDLLTVYPQGEQYLSDVTNAEIGEFMATGEIARWEAMGQ